MAYSVITNSEIASGAPPTTTLFTKLRDNPEAIASGLSGAPKVQGAAIQPGSIGLSHMSTDSVGAAQLIANSVGAAEISADAVGASELQNSSVHQIQMSYATGEVSTTSAKQVMTLPGGQFGFFPRVKSDTGLTNFDIGIIIATTIPATYESRITIGSNGSNTGYVEQTYITASPPYDLGDGEVAQFIFLEVEKSGKVVSVYCAPEAPWHHNGPTFIVPDVICKGGVQMLRERRIIDINEINDSAHLRRIANRLSRYKGELKEMTQGTKNADMDLIPTPMRPNNGNTVVMVDPVSDVVREALDVAYQTGVTISSIIYKGMLAPDNETLKRCGPKGVDVVPIKWA